MINYHQEQGNLTREQKQAVGLLSLGTFLEYFDLMLYVHMAVLLNELFLPNTDPNTTVFFSACTFCSIFIFRPFGALIFGWIGDNIGRKPAIIISTFMMSISCIIMANLRTYAQIDITAVWLITICRMLQGMASMGELIGAELYLTEITKPPIQYLAVALISFISSLAGTLALGVSILTISFGFNWRYAFWIGAGAALIGTVARTKLRETPEFTDRKCQIKKMFRKANVDMELLVDGPIYHEKVNKITTLSLFLISCSGPVCFYFIYIHCGNVLQHLFHYTSEQVLYHNFLVSIGTLLSSMTWSYLSYYIYPLKIIQVKLAIFSVLIIFCPYLLYNHINTPFDLLLMQLFCTFFAVSELPANSILYKHLPIFKRFTYTSFIYAISRAIMSIITSFGIIYLIEYLGYWGLLIIMLPMLIGYTFGFRHFKKLEIEAGNYPQAKQSYIVARG